MSLMSSLLSPIFGGSRAGQVSICATRQQTRLCVNHGIVNVDKL